MIRRIYSVNSKSWSYFKNNLLVIDRSLNYYSTNKLNSHLKSGPKMSKSLINILIVFNSNKTNGIRLSSKQTNYLFNSMKSSINEMTGFDRYTIYNMSADELQSSDSWLRSTAFVIQINQKLNDDLIKLSQFNGTLIKFGINDLLIDCNQDNYNNNVLKFNLEYFKQQMSTHFNINYQKDLNDCLNQLSFDEKNESKVYLITKDNNDSHFIESHKQFLESKIRLVDEKSIDSETCLSNEWSTESKMDLIVNANLENISFDAKTYFSNLKTTKIGHSLVFTDITDSTMTLIESFRGIDGFVAIANQQMKGRGRNRNEWLSPKGCAMFTAQLSIPLNSNIGQKLGFVQHLAALSVIKAIITIPGYEDLDIRVKWPNDVFCNRTKSKLSGILVTSLICGNKVNVLIGCGTNVYNSRPSLCLNDVIDNYNNESLTSKLEYIKCEEVIARTLTQLEILLSTFEQKSGIEIIKQLYTKHWMHSGESIKLHDNHTERVVMIEGLDNDGYLQVRDRFNGLVLSLHPDGNRFDMLHNLMISRTEH